MKKQSNHIFLALIFILVGLTGCDNSYIDPVTSIDPGSDELEPEVTIISPNNDVIIPFTEEETSLNFKIEASDDIELGTIELILNNQSLITYDNFLDYRNASETYLYENLPIGNYELMVKATDLTGKSTTSSFSFEVSNKYNAKYEGEIFYMPFESIYTDLISETDPGIVGTPDLKEGYSGLAYVGATDSYLTFPTQGLLAQEFSATFWYKVNADPDRAGILTIGPPDINNPDAANNRTSGFRFFREAAGDKQRFKLNVGNGTADSWFDGGEAADLPSDADWAYMAFTISDTKVIVYINGEVVKEGDFSGVDWTGCDLLSIGSGAPRFAGWGHLSDNSLIDELRIYNKALSQAEVKAVMNNE